MLLRRGLLAALVLVGVGVATPYAFADPTDSTAAPAIGLNKLPRPERPATTAPSFAKDHVLVRFDSKAPAASRQRALASRGASLAGEPAVAGFVKVNIDGDAKTALRELSQDAAVDSVSLDYYRTAAVVPNDTFYGSNQQYLSLARLPQAWDVIRSAPSQVIAVIDSGVDASHPDLAGRVVPGYNAVSPGASTTDTYGHGTLVAGVAAANTNNAVGVAGAAWNGRVMPVKASSGNSFLTSDIVEGIRWAADHGAKVINMSFAGFEASSAELAAVEYAASRGAVLVAAAGNEAGDVPVYPAAYPGVLAVGATDSSGASVDFSSWGDWVDVSAPGFGIASTFPGRTYSVENGTSFSAPLVSGVAALVLARYPSFTATQVANRIKATARDAGPRGIDPFYGNGIVDAFHAVGGTYGGEFAQPNVGDTNGTPARATVLAGTATGNVGIEGDVDWYRYQAPGQQGVRIEVDPPSFVGARSHNFDPVLEVYDAELRLLGRADDLDVTDATEIVEATVPAGSVYIAVRNYNGGRDNRGYTVSVSTLGSTPATTPGERLWVRDVAPAEYALNVPVATRPTVTFERELDPASVDSTTVRLLHGVTGAAIEATPEYDAATKTVTISPGAPLHDYTPYRIVVGAVRDAGGATHTGSYTSTFRTVNVAPAAVTELSVRGTYQGATLSWTLPTGISDLDSVIVRSAVGATPPASPTAGTPVYAGTSTGVAVTGLTAASYAFAVWVKDRAGVLSPVATVRIAAPLITTTATPASVTVSYAVAVTGKIIRRDTGAPQAGVPVGLYWQRQGTTTWTLLTTVTSDAAGGLSFSHKPSWGISYRYFLGGTPTLIGALNAKDVAVAVRPLITGTLSSGSIALGATATLSGSVTPAHAGQPVVLQRLVGGAWTNVTTANLSATSTYSFAIRPTARGTYQYRTFRAADADHAANATGQLTLVVS
ncbi:MAG TPA: S8 family serine peptidase [Pilimelia sp.]|nr:S8 family serine peptidase [Pilimelia sp.]